VDNKVVLVLSDGLRYDTAVQQMGFLYHLLESKLASLYKMIAELPAVSRPLYETTHTGLPVFEHGITSNQVVRRSNVPNVFQVAKDAGKTTAAAAYSWFSELYNCAPYDIIDDREVDDESLLIQHGRFYSYDEFPDVELFAFGVMLMRRFNPDYLLIHPMGVDNAGHLFGADSREYRRAVVKQDVILANQIFSWVDGGYTIIVTGDHGMNNDHGHNGNTPAEREVPLFIIRPGISGKGDTGEVLSQLQLAPTICKLLGISIPKTMKADPII